MYLYFYINSDIIMGNNNSKAKEQLLENAKRKHIIPKSNMMDKIAEQIMEFSADDKLYHNGICSISIHGNYYANFHMCENDKHLRVKLSKMLGDSVHDLLYYATDKDNKPFAIHTNNMCCNGDEADHKYDDVRVDIVNKIREYIGEYDDEAACIYSCISSVLDECEKKVDEKILLDKFNLQFH
jgi:hypothetical protein